MNIQELIQYIELNIKANGVRSITGTVLQQILIEICENITPSEVSKPLKISDELPTSDGIYLAMESGVYSNGITVDLTEGVNYLILDEGVWSKTVYPINFTPTGVIEEGNTQAVSGGEVYDSVVTNDDIKTIIEKNLFNKETATDGHYNVDGNIGNPEVYTHSAPIKIEKNTQYYGKGDFLNTSSVSNSDGMRFVVFRKEDGTIISGLSVWTKSFTSIDDDDLDHVIITILKTNKDSFQLELGNEATEYEAYSELISTIDGKKVDAFTKSEALTVFDTSEVVEFTINSTNIADISKATERFIVQSTLNNGCNYNPSGLEGWYGLIFPLDVNQSHIAIQGWYSNRNEIYFGKGTPPTDVTSITKEWSLLPEVFIESGNTSALGYGTKSDGRIVIPKPNDATWGAITLKSSTDLSVDVFENFMINYGQSYDAYKPYPTVINLVSKINGNNIGATALVNEAGEKFEIADFVLKGENPDDSDDKLMKISLITDDSSNSILEYKFNGKPVIQTLKPFRRLSNITSQCFEFADVYVNNIQVGKTSDDATPLRVGGATVGANHGWSKTIYTLIGHGKTIVDVGSVWLTGGKELVLINVPDVDTLEFTSRNDNTTTTTLTLTHVSGATNTASINATSVVNNGHLFPSIKNLVKRVFVDGEEIDLITNSVLYGKEVIFSESYDILDKSSMLEDLISRVGTVTSFPTQFEGEAIARVNNSYVFDMNMGCTQYQDVIGLKNGTELKDLMFVQAVFNNVDPPIRYYIPKTNPIPYDGNTYDFASLVNMSSFVFNSTSDNLNFTPTYTDSTGILADRVIRLHNSIGFAVGFIPTRSASVDERRINASTKALQIRGTKKIYMSLVDSVDKDTINKGDYYSAISYRKYFEKDTNRIAYYIIDTNEGSYLYADYSELTMDRLELPAHLVGKKFEVVEKSASIDILSDYASDGITISVNDKGYLILKF